eukprot:756138-Hanusia_phi.AAC.2
MVQRPGSAWQSAEKGWFEGRLRGCGVTNKLKYQHGPAGWFGCSRTKRKGGGEGNGNKRSDLKFRH